MTVIFNDRFLKQLSRHGSSPHYNIIEKFGHNNDIPTASYEDVWTTGGGNEAMLSSAETMNIASSSTADDTDGTGVEFIVIEGLDSSWNPISETVTMNGTADVLTSLSYLRVNRMYITGTHGSAGSNVGNITATASSAASVHGDILATLGQTEKSQYAVPASHKVWIFEWGVDAGRADDFDCLLMTRDNTNSSGWRIRRRLLVYQNDLEESLWVPVGEKSDIKVQAKALTNNNTAINTHYEMVLVKEFNQND